MNKIGVINYGMSNIMSIVNALEKCQIPYDLINHFDRSHKDNYLGFILPGVGSFGSAMRIVRGSYLEDYLNFNIVDAGIFKDNNPDRFIKILKKLKNSDVDIIVTSGAISAGKFDFIPELVNKLSFAKCFKGVAIKPGRPIMLSKFNKKNKLFFGLPGNPISCAAGFRFFVYPLIRKSLGMKTENKFTAKLNNKYVKVKNFTHFVRCFMNIDNRGLVKLKVLQEQQSNKIKSFVEANCWGIFPEGKDKFKKGEIIEWVPLIPSS